MQPIAKDIVEALAVVERQRVQWRRDPELVARVSALKTYQARRFERTYADLLVSSRYQYAARFFLEELYGPQDFRARDAQFARVVPSLVRLFRGEIIGTVAVLAALHALSETLDTAMARLLPSAAVDASAYRHAWRSCGLVEARKRQIELTIEIGQALDRYTRSALIRGALRLMRGPADAAGLGELQRFLERGFDAFKHMRGAEPFLAVVRKRESELAAQLFSSDDVSKAPVEKVGLDTTAV